jgi:hypothetical protein
MTNVASVEPAGRSQKGTTQQGLVPCIVFILSQVSGDTFLSLLRV